MSSFTDDDMKKLERDVMAYLGTKRGGKHYKTFERVYNLIEVHKRMRYTLAKLVEEIHRSSA